MKQVPLLQLLQQQYPEREKKELHAAVLCGEVTVEGERVLDPKRLCSPQSAVEITPKGRSYVSRGGEKLEAALLRWRTQVAGRVWLDAGASTGGFTDCLLRHGAAGVHAVDVGYNQLDYRLRRDRRVFVHERSTVMSLRHLEPPPAAAVADLSFRSLRGAAEHLLSLTTEKVLIALAKPQFETSRLLEDEYDGLIRSPQEAGETLKELIAALRGAGLAVRGIMASPLLGRAGNREFLLLVSSHERGVPGFSGEVEEEDVLRAAAEAFGGEQ